VIVEIGDFLERGDGILCRDHQFGGLVARVVAFEASFFFDFAAAGLVAAVDLGSSFLGPAFSLLAFT
jgi:hypothetical protein